MSERTHAAAPNVRGKNNHREIWAVDCETDPFKRGRVPKPFIWCAYNGTEIHFFRKGDALVNFLRPRECIAYAHNGGRFDWHYIIDQMDSFSPLMVIAGRLAKFRIGNCEFRDSWNIMPMPLRAGGKKHEIDDWSIFEEGARDKPENFREIEQRVKTDCIYLWDMIQKFIAEFGLHLTQAGASMHAWHKISGIEKPHTTSQFYHDIEPFYFGGRVECFTTGTVSTEKFANENPEFIDRANCVILPRPFKKVDINSAYSYAMLHRHPWGETINEQATLPEGRSAIQRSFITLEADATGAFPFRERDGSLGFPADKQAGRIFHVTGWEYLSALETGALGTHAISSVLRLPSSIDFREYVDFFYRMKLDAKARGDKALYEFAKKFLNSLYGKFGSNPDEYLEYQICEPRFIEAACEADGYQFCAELGPWALLARPVDEDRARFYNVAVAASVTGFIRAYDWRAIRSVRNVFYIDTDCLHCLDTESLALHDTELGAWKVESECDFAAYAGKKLYAAHSSDEWASAHPNDKRWAIASKGVRLAHSEIIDIANGKPFEYDPEIPQYSLKRGIQFVKRNIRRTARVN